MGGGRGGGGGEGRGEKGIRTTGKMVTGDTVNFRLVVQKNRNAKLQKYHMT